MELFTLEGWLFLLRWIHFLAGIMWIGLLYYFNFVQTPFFATAEAPVRSGMVRNVVPRALWWFRWGAMITFLTGWAIVLTHIVTGTAGAGYYALILTGGAMGTLMWFNVWFVIWPAQQVVIASAEQVAKGGEAIPEAAARGQRAGLASRTNTVLSIPMLFFMGAARHLTSLLSMDPSIHLYSIVAAIVILAVWINSLIGPGLATQKPLATVSGTLTMGFVLTLVLHVVASALL